MMRMRPLVIDDTARAIAARVLAHAKAHHYRPGPGQMAPGDDNRFVARLGTYRAVFSFTHSDGGVWRQLSVSVPSTKFPNPAAVFAIADLFGFSGYDEKVFMKPGPNWMIEVNDAEHCVVVAERVSDGESAGSLEKPQ